MKRAASPAPHKTTFEDLPPELILHIFRIAQRSILDLAARQQQAHNQALINQACFALCRKEWESSFIVKGYKQTRRLARILQAEPHREANVRRLEVDMMREERHGALSMIGELLVRAPSFKHVALHLKGKEGRLYTATLGVELYAALRGLDLESLEIRFDLCQNALTLGGGSELNKTLVKLKNLQRLHLPAVLVSQIDLSFSFAPSLTSLGLHLSSGGCLSLLTHLVDSSSRTLRHLHLTMHKSFEQTAELQQLLSRVGTSLRSLELWTATPPLRESRTSFAKRHKSISLIEVYPSLAQVHYLALAGELVGAPPPCILPSLRHFDFLCGPYNTFEEPLKAWVVEMRDDPARLVPSVRLFGRNLGQEWVKESLVGVADEAGVALWYEDDGGDIANEEDDDYLSAQ